MNGFYDKETTTPNDYLTKKWGLERELEHLTKPHPNEAWLNEELTSSGGAFIVAMVPDPRTGRPIRVLYDDNGTAKVLTLKLGRDDPYNHAQAIRDGIRAAMSKTCSDAVRTKVKEADILANRVNANEVLDGKIEDKIVCRSNADKIVCQSDSGTRAS
ncbi:hypothetical protein C8J25_101857 [Sphingomonas faeni]|uniref:Uncharacterized protein n=1 Tax=Sphingomonas faeni TaxID=185950 RepID=A0A2T5UCV8_9SPHN|nr:hypothetical protein [Sphingomonas faeni]PTW49349.1 hypothetical protein C8J25_101857 [Sphingomonas faeni]